MIHFNSRLAFRQYLPAKPIKWGVKVLVLAESDTGYLSRFQVYTGREPGGQERGLTHRVVTDLVDHLYGQYTQVYFDNFYTSTDLLSYLKVRQMYACGTVRSNHRTCRLPLCPRTSRCKSMSTRWRRKTNCHMWCGRTQSQCVFCPTSMIRQQWALYHTCVSGRCIPASGSTCSCGGLPEIRNT